MRRGSTMRTVVVAATVASIQIGAAMAAGEDPEWPCIQRKVPEITAGIVWAGPPVEDLTVSWSDNGRISDLVERLALRRTPLEEAAAEIGQFAKELGADKDQRLTLLFAGLLETINRERTEIMSGIVRYAKRQRALAEQVRQLTGELNALQLKDAPSESEQARIFEIEEKLLWDTRIFDEREQSLTFVCESPVLLEQRLFALAREIMAQLDE